MGKIVASLNFEKVWVCIASNVEFKKDKQQRSQKTFTVHVFNGCISICSNDPRLEGLLQNAVRRSLHDMGRRCVQELEKQVRPGSWMHHLHWRRCLVSIPVVQSCITYFWCTQRVWAYKTSTALLFVVLKSKSAVYDNLKEFNTFHNVLLLRSKFIEVKIPRDRRLPNWRYSFFSVYHTFVLRNNLMEHQRRNKKPCK